MIPRNIIQKKFRIFIFLSLFILVVEIAGGFFTNSLALLSDAGHVLVDLLALVLVYFSIRLSQKESTKKFTYGYYRAEILTAIINGIILIFITMFIFYSSYKRFISIEQIKSKEMLGLSLIGLFANLYVVIKMQNYERENLNIKSAYLHILSDTISSFGVVIAGILINITGNFIFDPIISVIIGLFILIGSIRLIKESTHILMEGTPAHINLERLTGDLRIINGVKEVHDVHVWSITSDVYALSSHILISKENLISMNEIISRINEMLKTKYNITHTVIQSEREEPIPENRGH
jgi:cobalt-zinc-cadmium efflux system protein